MSKIEDDEAQLIAFKARMVDLANAHAEAMRGMTPEATFDYVEDIVESSEVVFGLWHDDNEPNGIGMYVIKGSREMQAATVEKQDVKFRTDAVPCVSLEQAIAAKQMFGDEARKAN